MRQRKAANLSRRRALEKARQESVGDPVIGDTTPFIESLLEGHQLGTMYPMKNDTGSGDPQQSQSTGTRLNYFVTTQELDRAIQYTDGLARPVHVQESPDYDPKRAEAENRQHKAALANAEEAIKRIMKLSNGSGADRTRVNIQRCIEEFGRHNTDSVLPPKPTAAPATRPPLQAEESVEGQRAGPDTGSSEVQIAVMTAKILVLAKQLEKTGHKDKHNKRNLRLLVHKRQKLLKYLRKKERGGPRWQNLIEKLGLKEGSWQREISL